MTLGAILLLVAAMGCVAAELFFPSHGVLALGSILFALCSILLASRVSPMLGVGFALMVLVLGPVVFYNAIRIYPKTRMGRRVILRGPAERTMEPLATESEKRSQLVGMRGVATTVLRPAGIVQIGEDRIACVSEAEVIDPGTAVEVIRVSGLKVIVKRVA